MDLTRDPSPLIPLPALVHRLRFSPARVEGRERGHELLQRAIYSTLLGGERDDLGYGSTIDAAGNTSSEAASRLLPDPGCIQGHEHAWRTGCLRHSAQS